MRRWISRVAIIMMIMALAGCGLADGSAKRAGSGNVGVEDLLKAEQEKIGREETAEKEKLEREETAEQERSGQEEAGKEKQEQTEIGKGNADETENGKVDVDLTTLSSTLVYSEVYNMMMDPQGYVGKRIKMTGIMTQYHDPSTGIDYFSCIIQDATACCAQGIEFELKKEYVYPEDYPKEGEIITVEGIFDIYLEGQYQYCTLRDAVLW